MFITFPYLKNEVKFKLNIQTFLHVNWVRVQGRKSIYIVCGSILSLVMLNKKLHKNVVPRG